MRFRKIILKGLYQSLGLALYCVVVVFIMNNISKLFFHSQNVRIIQDFIFLTLFLVSALITGSIALAHPIILALRNNIKEAAFVVLSTVVWSILFLVIALIIIIII